jgi:hypothetical protein
MNAINLRELADRLNNLDEDQLKLIREQLQSFCPSSGIDHNLAEVVNALFTVTNENHFSKVNELKEAVDIAHSLHNIRVDDDVTLPLIVLHFLADLFKESPVDEVVICDCEKRTCNDELGLWYVKIQRDRPLDYYVGSDDAFAEELVRAFREDDDLTYLVPSFVYPCISECHLEQKQFCDAIDKITDEFVRADVYRMLLSPDDYETLASEAISTDGIAHCFHAVDDDTKEFDYRGETIYYIYRD